MVYLWKIPSEYPDKLIGEYDKNLSPDRFIFTDGEIVSIGKNYPVITFEASIDELKRLDCLCNNAMLPVISERLACTLKEFASADIQLIDVVISASDGELVGYSLLNVTAKVIGIDKAASKFTLIPGTESIMGFKSLRYSSDCMGDHMLARDAEYSSNLMVSDGLVERLITMNLLGVGLYRPEDMNF